MKPSKGKHNTLTEVCRALKTHDDYLLSCHVAPEGDAIGSLLAIAAVLKRLGKKVTVVCEDAFPERLSCLSDKMWHRVDEIKKPASAFKALVVTDCPTLERIGKVRNLVAPEAVIFNLDHHISNVNYGHYNYIRPEAAASGEVVMDIFKHFKMKLTKEDATNLYVALTTDTGSFKYSNTTVECHKMAAELIATGIDIEKINDQLYSTYSLNKINLYSRLMSRVKTTARGRIAWAVLKKEDLRQSGATYEDTEGFIDFLKYLREVKIAFFMSEVDPCDVKVSFRSKGAYDVNQIATYFQGGGHKKASGCTLHSVTLEEAEAKILDRIRTGFHFS